MSFRNSIRHWLRDLFRYPIYRSADASYDVENGAGSSIINFQSEPVHKLSVSATTLDEYCRKNHVVPTFLKIDIESSEYDMLLGGRDVLVAHRPTIAMEVWRSPYDFSNHLKAIALLRECGYVPFRINDEGDLERMRSIDPNRDIHKGADNFVFKVLKNV